LYCVCIACVRHINVKSRQYAGQNNSTNQNKIFHII